MKIKEKINQNKNIKQIKKYQKTLNKAWSNPKYKAAIKLSIWLIIILILACIVRLSDEIKEPLIEPIEEKEILEKNNENIKKALSKINSYEAQITIKNEEQTKTIEKIVNNNQEIIKYDNNIYNKSELPNELNIPNTDIKEIYELIKDKEEDYLTTYKDNSYTISYTVENSIENINIKISGINDISKIELESIQNNIIIELKNINNIEELIEE